MKKSTIESHNGDRPRFIDQVGHQTTNAFIGNKHCCYGPLILLHRLAGRNAHYVPLDPLCPMDIIRLLGISSVFNKKGNLRPDSNPGL